MELLFENEINILKKYFSEFGIIKIILQYNSHKCVKSKYFKNFDFNKIYNYYDYYLRLNFETDFYDENMSTNNKKNTLIFNNVIHIKKENYELVNFALYCDNELLKYKKYLDMIKNRSNKIMYYVDEKWQGFSLILYSININVGVYIEKSEINIKNNYTVFIFDFDITESNYMNNGDTLNIKGKITQINNPTNQIYFENKYIKIITHGYYNRRKQFYVSGYKSLQIQENAPKSLSIVFKIIAQEYFNVGTNGNETTALDDDDDDLNGIDYGDDCEIINEDDY
jgi:hypothetical protein